MTRICSASRSSGPRESSASSCEPSAEEREAAAVGKEREAEKEAEARRNAYFARGTDEGGRSYRATSDASRILSSNPDDPRAKAAARTAKIDPPLQDDVLGNAIVAAAAGGVLAGGRAAAGEVGLRGLRGTPRLAPLTRPLLKQALTREGPSAVGEGARAAASSLVTKGRNEAVEGAAEALLRMETSVGSGEASKPETPTTEDGGVSHEPRVPASGAEVPACLPLPGPVRISG